MPFVRKIVNSEILSGIMDIPNGLKNRKVEILVFPIEDGTESVCQNSKSKNAKGILAKYKNSALINQEATAWEAAMREKHENRRC